MGPQGAKGTPWDRPGDTGGPWEPMGGTGGKMIFNQQAVGVSKIAIIIIMITRRCEK